jgi:nitroimidazol reductase NimA-like FMN-containing flavoprotein (pyridoxamine 5'-phosphate oxidase superfamily)
MAKLVIPHANMQEKAIFEKFGIHLIESMTAEEFEKVAVAYISTHNVLNLATCRENVPRCTTLEYFNNAVTVYIMSEGGSKILSIQKNPLVSFTINDPYDPAKDYLSASGLQVWGRASIFKKHDDSARAQEIQKYFRNSKAVAEQGLEQAVNSVNFNMITIEPYKIRYLDLRRGFRNVVWEAD